MKTLSDELKRMLNITVATGFDIILHAEAEDVAAQCMIESETFLIRNQDVRLFIEDFSLELSNDTSSLIAEKNETELKTVQK